MRITTSKISTVIATSVLTGAAVFGIGYSLRPSQAKPRAIASIRSVKPAAISLPEVSAVATPGTPVPEVSESALEIAPPAAAFLLAQEASPAEDQSQVRVGTIVSMNGELFILRDDDHDTWYHLDDQRTAGSFLGKKVQVKGPVDPATDVIHVESIQDAKA